MNLTNQLVQLIKESSMKDTLTQMVVDFGFDGATQRISGKDTSAGEEKLAKIAFDNNPIQFLDLFSNLNVEEVYDTNGVKIRFSDDRGNVIFRYDPKSVVNYWKELQVHPHIVLDPLRTAFKVIDWPNEHQYLKQKDRGLLINWFKNNYKLDVEVVRVLPIWFRSLHY